MQLFRGDEFLMNELNPRGKKKKLIFPNRSRGKNRFRYYEKGKA